MLGLSASSCGRQSHLDCKAVIVTSYAYTCACAHAGVYKAVTACVYTCACAHACVRGSTTYLQHALQLLVDWLEHQLHLLTPPWPLARQPHPSSWEHRHCAAAQISDRTQACNVIKSACWRFTAWQLCTSERLAEICFFPPLPPPPCLLPSPVPITEHLTAKHE